MLARADAEVSGLAWAGDTLVVLPQYPARDAAAPRLLGLTRAQIDDALARLADEGRADPLVPFALPLVEADGGRPDLLARVPGYQGFEAVAVRGARVGLLVEATGPAGMRGACLTGRLVRDRGGVAHVVLDAPTRLLPPQTNLPNMAYEALVLTDTSALALYEANGAQVNPNAVALRLPVALRPPAAPHDTARHATTVHRLPMPALEYRLTDATTADSLGRVWVTNYLYPGEREVLRPAPDAVRLRHGTGATHAEALRTNGPVERLVALRLAPGGPTLDAATPPVLLRLAEGATRRWDARNWEGLARFTSRTHGPGFLVATDRYPRTLLAFVPREAPGA
jgi:hypothetical protein